MLLQFEITIWIAVVVSGWFLRQQRKWKHNSGVWSCDGDTAHPGPNDPALLTLNQLHRPPCNNFKFNRIPSASIIDYSMGWGETPLRVSV